MNYTLTIAFKDLGLSGAIAVRDVWMQKDVGTHTGEFTAPNSLAPHDSGFFVLKRA
jgi:hypothetical protein